MTLPVSICVPLQPHRRALFEAVCLPTLEAASPAEILIDEGPGNANEKRNRAAADASQPWLFFCDDDVLLEVHALSRMLTFAKRADLVYGDYFTLNHPTRGHAQHRAGPWSPQRLRRENYISTMSLLRRSAFDEAGRWDEEILRYQDWDLWLRVADHGFSGRWFDRVIFAAVYTPGGITQRSGIHAGMDAIAEKHGLERWWNGMSEG